MMVVWCPDWPVIAAEIVDGYPAQEAVAVMHANRVLATSPAAREDGVRRGLRKREAQGRCPHLIVVEHDPVRDARAFEPVLAAVEEVAAGVETLRPGVCAVAARGPARYFGGEEAAAERLVEQVAVRCAVEAQVGIAEGAFGAGLAARAGRIVPAGETSEFLAGLAVAALGRPALVDLLRRLGIHTLGEFAALPAGDVLTRFGFDAALAHRLAGGRDEQPFAPRQPPPDLEVSETFDEPLDRVDAAAFAGRGLAERLHALLSRHGLACTRLAIEAVTEAGEELYRTWRHDGLLTSAAIADRVRWQLDGWLTGTNRNHGVRPDEGRLIGGNPAREPRQLREAPRSTPTPWAAGHPGQAGPPGARATRVGAKRSGEAVLFPGAGGAFGRGFQPATGIVRLRLVPEGIVTHLGLQQGLWGEAGEERDRAHRALTRVQGLLGPEAVLTAVESGGRGEADQIRLVPWGDERVPTHPVGPPWPGRLPQPTPVTVYPLPLPAAVLDATGEPVGVTARLAVTAAPAQVVIDGESFEIAGWAGPWPVDERWWDGEEARRVARFQLLLADGQALLVVLSAGTWTVAARYD